MGIRVFVSEGSQFGLLLGGTESTSGAAWFRGDGPGPDPRSPVALFLPHQDSYFAQSRHRPSLISMPNLVGLVDRYIVCMQMPRIYNLQTLGTEYQRPKPLWKDWSPGQHRHNLPAQATLQHISAPAGYRFTYPTMPS